jgi:hypothetical protein
VQLFERRRVRDGQCSTDPWHIVKGNLNIVVEFAGMDVTVLLLATVTYEDTLSSMFQEWEDNEMRLEMHDIRNLLQ